MQCKFCTTEQLTLEECSFCGESQSSTFYDLKQILKPDVKGLTLKLNQWANSISDHDHVNLGDNVTFTKVQSMPAHAFGIKTVYDTRTWSLRYFVGNKNNTKRRTVGTNDIDPWSMKFNHTSIPSELEIVFNQMETISTIDCPQCNSGSVTCGVCNGNCEIGCSCKDGQINCRACGGDGTKWHEGFKKEVTCVKCGGGRTENCGPCSGSGFVKCYNCNGKGDVKCGNCAGNGVLDEKLVLTSNVVLQSNFIQENGKTTSEGKDIHDRDERVGFILYDIENGNLPPEAKVLIPIAEFHAEIDELVQQHDEVEENTRIVRRKIWIERKPLIQVEYKFQEKPYCFFLKNAAFTLIDSNSPIKEMSKKLAKESSALLLSSNLADLKKGVETLEKAFRQAQDLKSAHTEFENFKRHLGELCLKGAKNQGEFKVGADILNFREITLGRKDGAYDKYVSDFLSKYDMMLMGVSVVIALAFTFLTKISTEAAFFTVPVFIGFFVMFLAISFSANGFAIENLTVSGEKKNVNFFKFALAAVLACGGGYMGIVQSSGLGLFIGLIFTTIPLLGRDSKSKVSNKEHETCNDSARKEIFRFLDTHWSTIKPR